jgi:rRNA-processing protein FCF1
LAFDEQELIDHIKASGKHFMVQGQNIKKLEKHTKPHSLDVWLRTRFPKKEDTKLADNCVLNALVKTKKFVITEERCLDSERLCKAIGLV